MLDLMRKHARNWLVKILIGMVIIVFIFYFGSIRGRDRAETIASLDDQIISYVELQREYHNLLDFYRQRYGDKLSDDMLKALNLKQQAYDNIINQAVILHKAKEFNIQVTEEEVRASILSNPSFHRGGVFDERIYQQVLRYRKISPADFEVNQKKLLTMMKLENIIQSAVKVSDRDVFDLYRMQNEKINANYIRLPIKGFRDKIRPDRRDLEAYLKQHEEEFRVPEQIKVNYLSFSGEDFSSSVKIFEAEIADYYERHRESYRGKGGKPAPLPEVRNKIASELIHRQAMQKASEAAKKAHDTIYQKENFEDYARQHGLEIHSTGFFNPNKPPQDLRLINDFPAAVLNLKTHETSSVLSDNKRYYLLKVVARNPSYIPSLKEIETEVNKRYGDEESRNLGKKEADAILDRLKKGEMIHKVAQEKGLRIEETGLFVPASPVPKLGPSRELGDALAVLSEKNPYPENVFPVQDHYVIVRFKERGKLNTADFEAKKALLKVSLRRMKASEYILSWLEKNKEYMIKEGRLKILKDVKDL
jgi:peptidyl-prolyl cis-trans isomerase D